ncbi:MAG: hypothetical protein BWY32_02808 [bacterium ADurb.Bin243]|nr:MAG: hypothetical protein BWY32_02808 [bacterium ADurb.Bin243]
MRHKISTSAYLYRLEKHSEWYCKNHKFDSYENKKGGVVMINLIKKALFITAVLMAFSFVGGLFFGNDSKQDVTVAVDARVAGRSADDAAAAARARELDEQQRRMIEAYKAKEKEQFVNFLNNHLSALKKEEYSCAEQAVSDLYYKIYGYRDRARGFAEEISGIAWCVAKDHEVKGCFEKHIFGEYAVNEMINAVANNFANKSTANRARFNEAIVSEAKAAHYKYLSAAEINRVAEVALANYKINFNGVLGKVEFKDYAFYHGGGIVGGTVASFAAEFALSRVLSLLTARAAILGTGAVSSWYTFGVSLAVGYAVDKYATNKFIENIEGEVKSFVEKTAREASDGLKKQLMAKLGSEFVAVP